MKLSIITINRNNAEGLAKTMASVFCQSYSDLEYIIIDGASTDDSVRIAEDAIRRQTLLTSERVLFSSEPDSGIYNAMNKGIAKASGEYLLFLNSGDTLSNNHVVRNFNNLINNEDIIVGRINFTDGQGIRHTDFQKPWNHESLSDFFQCRIPHQASFIRRSLFDDYGYYDEKHKVASDWKFLFNVLVLNQRDCSFIPLTIADFDNNGISSTDNKGMMLDIEDAFKESIPSVIFNDYKFIRDNYSDFLRIKWISNHPLFKSLFKTLVSIGRRIAH